MEDLSKFCCQNKDCPDYGRYGLNNLTVCGRFGRHKHIRLLYCRTCKYRFSERKGTPLFRLRLDDETMASVFNHISEGCGVRKTSRLVGVHRDTVAKYRSAAGGQVKELYQELIANNNHHKKIPEDKTLPLVNKKDSPRYENHLEESKPIDRQSLPDATSDPEELKRSIFLEHKKVLLPQLSDVNKENKEIVSDSKDITG